MKAPLACFSFLAVALAAPAALVTRTINYEQGGVKLAGYLVYDEAVTAKGKVPGVLVVPEWWGLNDYAKGRAEQLAKLGYVAFAVDMYGGGLSTTDAKQASDLAGQFYSTPRKADRVERAQAGLNQLLQTGLVDPARIAAIGYCFGGSVVQALAYSGAPLAGIVSFHGGLIRVPSDAAEKNKAKILICTGAIDPSVPPSAVAAFTTAMNEGKFDYQFISYSGALHAFTNPDADRAAADGVKGVAYNATADHRSWAAMQTFFSEIFTEKK
ncbi:MAG: dienelactone hydrolase family protein [Opitutaceae bacterium]